MTAAMKFVLPTGALTLLLVMVLAMASVPAVQVVWQTALQPRQAQQVPPVFPIPGVPQNVPCSKSHDCEHSVLKPGTVGWKAAEAISAAFALFRTGGKLPNGSDPNVRCVVLRNATGLVVRWIVWRGYNSSGYGDLGWFDWDGAKMVWGGAYPNKALSTLEKLPGGIPETEFVMKMVGCGDFPQPPALAQ